jgi:stage V sporulation protein B
MNQVEIKRLQIQDFSDIIALVGLLFLGGLLRDNGIAYIAAAYEIFSLMWIIMGKYMPDAIAAILKPRNGKAPYRNILKVKHRLLAVSMIIGLVGAIITTAGGFLLLYFVFNIQNASYIMFFLAPAFCLRSINAVLLGFFQGEGAQLPSSVASVLRVVFTIGFAFLFGSLFKNYGIKVSTLLLQDDFTGMYAAFGVAMAMSVAEFFILIFLTVIYRGSSGSKKVSSDSGRAPENIFGLIESVYSSMSEMMLCSFLLRLPVAVGLLLYLRNAIKYADMSVSTAIYGSYYGRYLAVSIIVILFIDIMIMPVAAKTSSYLRKSDMKPARWGFQSGVHMTVLTGVYMSVVFAALSEQIAGFISRTNTEYVTSMLKFGSFMILFTALADLFIRLMYLIDRKVILYAVLAGADVLFIIFTSIFLNTADMGIMSVVYGGLIMSAVLCIALGFFATKLYDTNIDMVQSVAVPAGSACVCGLAGLLLGKLITPYLGNSVSFIVCFAVTFFIYMVILFALRNFRDQELKLVPGGKIISAVGHMLHLL